MEKSILKGSAFGLTSGIITTLGLIVGLHSGTGSRAVVLGGIVTIAIADSLSDALGIHISEEASGKNSRHVWTATVTTFVSKLLFASMFMVPMLLFELDTAIYVSIGFGLALISLFSFYIGKSHEDGPWRVMLEHLLIAVVVVIATHYVGDFVGSITA
jgi:vacuolar iron transporter family protein